MTHPTKAPYNRSQIMTEAHAIVARHKALGNAASLSEALRSAWFTAGLAVHAARNGSVNRFLGMSEGAIRAMIRSIDNIDRQSTQDRADLVDLYAAL
jgi:hypothetical protein